MPKQDHEPSLPVSSTTGCTSPFSCTTSSSLMPPNQTKPNQTRTDKNQAKPNQVNRSHSDPTCLLDHGLHVLLYQRLRLLLIHLLFSVHLFLLLRSVDLLYRDWGGRGGGVGGAILAVALHRPSQVSAQAKNRTKPDQNRTGSSADKQSRPDRHSGLNTKPPSTYRKYLRIWSDGP